MYISFLNNSEKKKFLLKYYKFDNWFMNNEHNSLEVKQNNKIKFLTVVLEKTWVILPATGSTGYN